MASKRKADEISGEVAVPEALAASLAEFGQSHLLTYMEKGLVSPEDGKKLIEKLALLDFKRVRDAFESTKGANEGEAKEEGEGVEPPDTYASVNGLSEEEKAACFARGMAEIIAGRAAVLVLGGGQGTRLGFDGPKGMYDIGLPSKATLFQMYAQRVKRLEMMADEAAGRFQLGGMRAPPTEIPFVVMTSPLNHETTTNYFAQNSYFGLKEEQVRFFPQGTLPALTPEGKIVMTNGSTLSEAPDGNGGIYDALRVSGTLDVLEARGVRSVHVFSVDNAICKVCDPLFIGYCLGQGAAVGNKVVWKASAGEKVGVVAKRNGRPAIIEYSELGEEMAAKVDAEGKLLYGAGNICNHYFTLAFLRQVATAYRESPQVLPYHLAKKKVPYAGEDGNTVVPETPNAVKLEAFIFDSFPLAASSAILEVNREEEFSPVKNAPGAASDSPDTARAMIAALHASWIAKAGGSLEGGGVVEISPLVSYGGEGLKGRTGAPLVATADAPLLLE